MTLSAKKLRDNKIQFTYEAGLCTTNWVLDLSDVDVNILAHIVDTVQPAPRVWEDPEYDEWDDEYGGVPLFVQPELPGFEHIPYPENVPFNEGAAAADRAAREEEQRLMNMGSALSRGLNMGPDDIPVLNDPGDMPEVNWGV